jgi:hypothetical protein
MDLPTKLDVQRPSQKYLACPARFERATYALEAVKMRLNNSKKMA